MSSPDTSLIRRAAHALTRRESVSRGYSGSLQGKYLYFGNLLRDEPQFANPAFVGICLVPRHERELRHDLREPLPVAEGSVDRVQAQDVLEHLPLELVPSVLDDVFRVLRPGGVFRMSVPDYLSPVQRSRSVFDEHGEVLADLMIGGQVRYDPATQSVQAVMEPGGDAHLWFPTIAGVRELVASSALSQCSEIIEYQYFTSVEEYVCLEVPENEMPISRMPPHDMRAGGRPVSIVIDFIK